MEKFSLTDIKKMNYSDVYHYIYLNDSSSKQSIANALQMSLPTVTQHLKMLLAEELIEVCGQLSSQIGRKAAAYTVVPNARVALGVEILKKQVSVVAVDLYGCVFEQKKIPLPFDKDEQYFEALCREITVFIEENRIEKTHILGIGFALQGLVSQDGRSIIYGKILECTGGTIEMIENDLDYPCRFIHDAECAAMTELWDQKELTDALYLSLGLHLGGAVIIGGEIQNGRTGRSGTIEHMTIYPGGRPCYCGQRGCMECYCSGTSLLEGSEDLESFFSGKENGDITALKRWNKYLTDLAMAVNNLHMVIDSAVIIGGHMAPYMNDKDLNFLHRQMRKITAFPEEEDFISLAKRKKSTVEIGAALYYIKNFLAGI